MILRNEIEPRLIDIKKNYLLILKLISDYNTYTKDLQTIKEKTYEVLRNQIIQLSNIDIEYCEFLQWINVEKPETIAYRLSLIAPNNNKNITKDSIILEIQLNDSKFIHATPIHNLYYPKLLNIIIEYYEYCLNKNNLIEAKYKKLRDEIFSISQNDIYDYEFWEWYDAEGVEAVSISLSLPTPLKILNITKRELYEIITQMISLKATRDIEDNFLTLYNTFLVQYYHQFLEINFERYNRQLFDHSIYNLSKDHNVNVHDIVEKIWV